MVRTRRTLVALAIGVAAAGGCNRAQGPLSPEAARAKGDAIVRAMSDRLAALQTFAYTADERREVVAPGGTKTIRRAVRHVTVRRPNAVLFTADTDQGDVAGWYDGSHLTLVSNRAKVWARGPMPATLDQALDFLSAEYAIQMPTADLLYSSAYDALMTNDTQGGWVDVQKIGDMPCEHLSYQQALVNWELWTATTHQLPCQIKITYKKDPGQPSTTVTYGNLELPKLPTDAFTAKVPDGYKRIKIVRHATERDPNPTPVATAGQAQSPAAKPSR